MIRSQLNSYSGADPIWGFVALIGSERYTGAAAVGIDPRIRLFAVEGRVYFAEREGDAPIGTRLVNCGAVSTTQLEHGAVQIGETSSLARLFQREPSIDRDAVELTIELATESLLASVANKAVGMPEVFPLRHHSSGVHHWLRSATTSAALALPIVESVVVEEPVIEEMVDEPITSSFVALSTASLPTLSSMTGSAADHTVAPNLTTEEVVTPEPVTPEAVTPEAVTEELPTAEPLLAPMPALASLTLPSLTLPSLTLQSASAPHDAQTSLAAGSPTLASTSADFVSSLSEPAAVAPTDLPEPAEGQTGLPKLASAPISMIDLAVAKAVPPSPFGEPTHNLVAVDIWQMVDVLTDDGHEGEQSLVGSGSSENQGRGWLRGRKG